jgi:endonuclease V-like protein UPF0215 family
MRRLSNVAGVDDAPFARDYRGDVPFVVTVCARTRLDGVLVGRVRRDGSDATRRISRLIVESAFFSHLQAVLLQGVALAGFNVVDAHALHAALGLPVLVVVRRLPDHAAVRRALIERVAAGRRKWSLIERLGPCEALAGVFVQRVGATTEQARQLLADTTLHGMLPEPLRLAHLIAGAIATGHSRGGA